MAAHSEINSEDQNETSQKLLAEVDAAEELKKKAKEEANAEEKAR